MVRRGSQDVHDCVGDPSHELIIESKLFPAPGSGSDGPDPTKRSHPLHVSSRHREDSPTHRVATNDKARVEGILYAPRLARTSNREGCDNTPEMLALRAGKQFYGLQRGLRTIIRNKALSNIPIRRQGLR